MNTQPHGSACSRPDLIQVPGKATQKPAPKAEGLQMHGVASEDAERILQYILGGGNEDTFPSIPNQNSLVPLHGGLGHNYLYWFRRGLPKYFQLQNLQPRSKLFKGLGSSPSALGSPKRGSAKTTPALMPAQDFLPKSHFSSLHAIFLTAFVWWSSDNVFTTLSKPNLGR